MKLFCLFFIIMVRGCCDNTNNTVLQRKVQQLNTSDTFMFEFPKREGFFDSSLYNDFIQRDKQLGLKPIFKGADSIEIRIHYGGAMAGERLVVLHIRDKEWKAEVFNIKAEVKPGVDIFDAGQYWDKYFITSKPELKVPQSGWGDFIQKLFDLQLLVLPDDILIPGYMHPDSNDAPGVSVEVATKNLYRAYTYMDPTMYHSGHPEPKAICRILDLIDEELQSKKLWEYTYEGNAFPGKAKKIKIQEMKIQEAAISDSQPPVQPKK